jgi:AcrR family transcriptional regulator
MSADEAAVDIPAVTATRRELALARAVDSARSRAENRVELFLDAARELVNAGSGDFTVQEVVERSGQSLRTFYQYFAGKHELLLALFEESIRSVATQLEVEVDAEHDPLERLHRFADEYYRMCRPTVQGRPAGVPGQAIVESARAFAPLVVLLEQLLADAAAAGEVRPGLDHRRIAGVVLQATMFNAFSTTISGSAASPDGDVESGALWDLLLLGIGTPE